MAVSLDGFNDTSFISPENRRNRSLIRYNNATGSFDLVYIDTTLGIITDSPQALTDRVVDELIINNITNNTIDGGVF